MTATVRVLPLLVVAGLCLFALKSMGLLLSGGYVVSGVAPAKAQNPDAGQAMPVPAKADPLQEKPAEETGFAQDKSSAKTDPNPGQQQASLADKGSDPAPEPQKSDNAPDAESLNETPKAELAVLEGLANRRKDLDKREKQIDLRENLLKAAEKRVEARIAELKSIQAQIEGELKKQDDFRQAQYDNLVKMYAAMKPKDAARIFDQMELDILSGLATQMKPRVMSAILAEMKPAVAQRLTLEMATRGKRAAKPAAPASLPKIESKSADKP